MGVIVIKSELEEAKSIYKGYFDAEEANSSSLIQAVNSFREVHRHNGIMGRPWNEMSFKLGEYIKIIDKRKSSADEFKECINAQLGKLISAWDGDFGDKITHEKINTAEANRDAAARLCASLQAEVDSGNTEKEGELQAAREEFNKWKALVEKYYNYIDLLNGAQGVLQEVYGNIYGDFGMAASSITPSQTYTFISN